MSPPRASRKMSRASASSRRRLRPAGLYRVTGRADCATARRLRRTSSAGTSRSERLTSEKPFCRGAPSAAAAVLAAVMPGSTRMGRSRKACSRARSSNSSPAMAKMPGSPEQTMQTVAPAAAAARASRQRSTSPFMPVSMRRLPWMRSRMKSTYLLYPATVSQRRRAASTSGVSWAGSPEPRPTTITSPCGDEGTADAVAAAGETAAGVSFSFSASVGPVMASPPVMRATRRVRRSPA